jgi:GT2 family glycosyltransferase
MAQLISVVIAAYNAAPYIAHAINSVLQQTYGSLEVIVIDDGSTDSTAAIVSEIAQRDVRVVLLTGAPNAGVSAARNRGIAIAKGHWIAILDADDLFHPQRLERLLEHATAHELDLIADNLDLRDFTTKAPCGKAFPDGWISDRDITVTQFLQYDLPGMYRREIGFIKPLMRAEFLREHAIHYDTSVWAGEDFLLYLTCLKFGARLRLVPDALYIYHLRPGSASSGPKANLELKRGNLQLTELLAPQDPQIRELIRLRQALINYELFAWWLKQRKIVAAAKIALDLPPSFLTSKITVAMLRRLGVKLGNPSSHALERVIEQGVKFS